MTTNAQSLVFDYRTLRLMIGIFAFSLPFVVWRVAQEPLIFTATGERGTQTGSS